MTLARLINVIQSRFSSRVAATCACPPPSPSTSFRRCFEPPLPVAVCYGDGRCDEGRWHGDGLVRGTGGHGCAADVCWLGGDQQHNLAQLYSPSGATSGAFLEPFPAVTTHVTRLAAPRAQLVSCAVRASTICDRCTSRLPLPYLALTAICQSMRMHSRRTASASRPFLSVSH